MDERPDALATPPSAPAPGTTDPPAGVDLDEELVRPRVSPRRRAAQVGAVLAIVLIVVVGLLLHGLGPGLQGTAALLPSPTPTPATVVIESNVTFGTLTVNGHTMQGAPPLVTHLFHLGTNVVTLTAPPFRTLTCHFPFPIDNQPSSEPGCGGGS